MHAKRRENKLQKRVYAQRHDGVDVVLHHYYYHKYSDRASGIPAIVCRRDITGRVGKYMDLLCPARTHGATCHCCRREICANIRTPDGAPSVPRDSDDDLTRSMPAMLPRVRRPLRAYPCGYTPVCTAVVDDDTESTRVRTAAVRLTRYTRDTAVNRHVVRSRHYIARTFDHNFVACLLSSVRPAQYATAKSYAK